MSTARNFLMLFVLTFMVTYVSAQEVPGDSRLSGIEERLRALEGKPAPEPVSGGAKIWGKVTPVLQLRTRYEYRDNYNFDRNTEKSDRDHFALLRSRIGLDAKPVDGVRLFIQMQDSREYGSARLTPAIYGPGNVTRGVSGDDEGTSLHQGYARLNWSGLFVQAGRQEYKLGEERLVGVLDWSNRGRSFDGAVVGYKKDELLVEGFWFIVARGDPAAVKVASSSFIAPVHPITASATIAEDARFGGFHALYTTEKFGSVDAYYLSVTDRDGGALRAGPPASLPKDNDLVLHTAGAHLWKKPATGEIDWSVEGAFQWGEDGYLDHQAGAFHGAVGFTAEMDFEPRLKLEYNYATGDKDPTDNKSRAFRNLFPTNHNKYGYIDFMQWSNMHEIHPEIGMKMGPVKAELGYHEFFAADEEGAIGAGAALLPALAGRTSRHFGRELDFTVSGKPFEAVSLLFGYSFFNPGKMFKQTPNANPLIPLPGTVRTDATHFLYLQGTVQL